MDDKLTVATVLKPQGIRGEIKVKVLCDCAEDLFDVERLVIGDTEYEVMNVRGQGDFAYISLKGVFDRNAAELLRGLDVLAYREELPELPEGTYYIADLTGCKVLTEKGGFVGEVVAVTPAHTDVYELKTPSGTLAFAAAEGVIETVDVENRTITVNEKRFKEVSL